MVLGSNKLLFGFFILENVEDAWCRRKSVRLKNCLQEVTKFVLVVILLKRSPRRQDSITVGSLDFIRSCKFYLGGNGQHPIAEVPCLP